MGKRALRAVPAKAQKLFTVPQHLARKVIQRVHLVFPRRDEAKSRAAQLARERAHVRYAKLDFDLPRGCHQNQTCRSDAIILSVGRSFQRKVSVKSLFQADAVDEVTSRIDKLQPTTQHLWGRMDVAQMMAHCSATLDVASGQV